MVIAKSLSFVVCAISLTVIASPLKMPTRSEINGIASKVEELASSGVSADEFLQLADETTNGAERYHFCRQAFIMSVKDKKSEEAVNALTQLSEGISDLPQDEIIKLIEECGGRFARTDEKLSAILTEHKSRIGANRQLDALRQAAKKSPTDMGLRMKLAETLVAAGDWNGALKEFFSLDRGEIRDIAKIELTNPADAKTLSKLANFWWNYSTICSAEMEPYYKSHAVSLYEEVASAKDASLLDKKLAEKRLAEFEASGAVVVQPAVEKKEGRQVLLSRLCNTKGLIHCWRFNGDLKDCVGQRDAFSAYGNPILECGQVHFVEGGDYHICLGKNCFPTDGSDFTIEIWATQQKFNGGSRIFTLGSSVNYASWATWGFREPGDCEIAMRWSSSEFVQKIGSPAPFNVGQEYHIAAVYSHRGDKWVMALYKQDANTGKTLGTSEISVLDSKWSPVGCAGDPRIDLCCNWTGGSRSIASYNEVRIWNRALSEKELTQNAIKFHKAGEASKPADKSTGAITRNPQGLATMTKLCDTKDLIHCWRFNGDVKDCIGDKDARLFGAASLVDGQAVIDGGNKEANVYLGDHVIPNDGSPVTIEMWATENKVQNWSRIFVFGDGGSHQYRIEQVWSWKTNAMRESFAVAFIGEKELFDADKIGPFDLGKEYHLAFVFEHDKSGSLVATRYKQDAKTGATIRSASIIASGLSLRRFSQMKMWLGHSMLRQDIPSDYEASASYNEVRIWNRALSEKELTQNAIKFHKAGETSKGSVAIKKENKSSSPKSTAFGTLIE